MHTRKLAPAVAGLLSFALASMAAHAASATTETSKTSQDIPNMAGKVLTVLGPVDPATLGPTLMHEHIHIRFGAPMSAAGKWSQQTPEQKADTKVALAKAPDDWVDQHWEPEFGRSLPLGWNTLNDFNSQVKEVTWFKQAGGGTIVDVSNFGLSRAPGFLKHISMATGLNIVMGSGWYEKHFHPRDMSVRSVEELTGIIVHDITVGAQNTGIRSGIIGEVGIEGDPLTDNELKSARASARASRITGAPITFHMGGKTPAEKQRILDIVESEGVDLNHVVMGHTSSSNVEAMKAITSRGAYIEFDFMGAGPKSMTPEAVNRIASSVHSLIKGGLTKRILLAHDICTQMQLKKNGGGGYAYISNYILPALRELGVSKETIHTIMVENPRRVLTFVAPQAPVL